MPASRRVTTLCLCSVLTLALLLPSPSWAKGPSAEEVLLAKLGAAAQVEQAAALAKERAPAAKLVVGGAERTAAIEKLRALVIEERAGLAQKLQATEQDAGAVWLRKLVQQARSRREQALAKTAVVMPRAGKVAAVQQADEDETSAISLALGDSLSGVIGVAGDMDAYVFSGTAGSAVVIGLTSADFDTFLELEFKGEIIANNDDGGEGLNSLIADFVLPASGDYTIRVHEFGDDATGAYQISLNASERLVLVGAIAAGSSTEILPVGGRHYYSFELSDQAQVELNLISPDFDTFLTLYAGTSLVDAVSDNQLYLNDDGGEERNSRIAEVLSAGSYLVEARAFSSSAAGVYTLDLGVVLLGEDEDATVPAAIAFGDTVQGGIFPVGDTDGWAFSGEAGEVVEISLASADFDAFLELELAGEVIAVDDDGGAGFNSLLTDFVLPASGEYVIRAHELGDNGTGTYQLSIVATGSNFTFHGTIESGLQEGVLPAGGLQFYSFVTTGLAQVQIDLVSTEFDPFLVLYVGDGLEDRTDGNLLLSNDDGGVDRNSRISEVLSAGVYLIEVRSFREGETGAYGLDLEVVELGADEDADGLVVIEFGTSAGGAIFPEGDIDGYTFDGVAGEVVEIGLTSADFDAFLELEFNGEIIASNDDGGLGFNSLLSDFVLPASGEYAIRVHELGDNGIGDYTLTVAKTEVPIVLQAAIEPGAYTGGIDAAGNVHLYTFTAANFSAVQIDLVSEDFDAFLVLYTGDGLEDRSVANVVAFNDDGGSGFNSRISALVAPGTYLIEARPLVIGQLGTYALDLALTAIEGDEDDPSAPVMAYGDSLAGQIFPAGDIDSYAFSGAAGDLVTIDLESADFDAFLELVRAGESIAADDDGGTDLNSRLQDFALPASGDYLIRVHELGDDGEGSYGIRLVNATPPLLVQDTLTQGNRVHTIAASGEIHLHPLVVAERTDVQIDIASADFAPALALYSGERRSENLVAAADSGAVQIAQELAPGSYLVEVRPAAGTGLGDYALELKLELVQVSRDRIALNQGQLNGLVINAFNPVVAVEPGQKITGTLSITVNNTHPGSEVFPVGATPTWGDRESSYWEIDNWAGTGNSSYAVAVDLTAPTTVGSYYLIFAAAAELTVADIMSGTHWISQPAENWGDDDDVAAWGAVRLRQAISRGWVNVDWFDGYNVDIGASAVRIEVVEGASLPAGPVSIDFDQTAGDQAQRQLEEVSAGQVVEVQLHAAGVEAISGWSARINFDPEKVLYVSSSFAPGDFIPGLVALVDEKDGRVEVGGTLLGTGDPGEGEGVLGTLSFVVGEGFSFSADLVISQVSLRTVASGQIKQQVRSVGTLSAGASEPTGPVSLDFDLAAGDQAEREAKGATAGGIFELQLNVDAAPEIRGWSVRIEYDPQQLRYVSNSFRGSGFIAGLVPLVGEKSGRVDVGGTVLGSAETGAGSGELGTVSFEILDGFTGSAEVVMTQVSLNTIASGEVIDRVRATASFSDAAAGPASDFSGDGAVDFSDFFLFADHFGFADGEAGYDSVYDLNASGEVDFSDFFIFADSFNAGAQGKLMALAREHIGLPEASGLEQNYPNPFNSATTIAYHIVAPGAVRLEIYDISGQRVRELEHGYRPMGTYRAVWDGVDEDGRAVSSGVYFYALRAGGAREINKMLYVK